MYGWKFIISSSAEIVCVANFGILSFSYSVNIQRPKFYFKKEDEEEERKDTTNGNYLTGVGELLLFENIPLPKRREKLLKYNTWNSLCWDVAPLMNTRQSLWYL